MRGEEEEIVSSKAIGIIDAPAVDEAPQTATDVDRPKTKREATFASGLAGFARRYEWEYRDQPGSNDLCIVFSPAARRFALMNFGAPLSRTTVIGKLTLVLTLPRGSFLTP